MDRYDQIVNALNNLEGDAFGYLLSSIRNVVTIKGNLTKQKEIQDSLEQLVYRLLCVYLFAIFEDTFTLDEIKKKHRYFQEYLAYRHIRHSFAHCPIGKRARMHREEFELEYEKGALKNFIDWDKKTDTIKLKSNFPLHLKDFLIKSVGILANYR